MIKPMGNERRWAHPRLLLARSVHFGSVPQTFLNEVANGKNVISEVAYEAEIDQILDKLAAHLETHINLDAMLETARRF